MPDQTIAVLDCIENFLSRLRLHGHRRLRLHLQPACLYRLLSHHCLPHDRNLQTQDYLR